MMVGVKFFKMEIYAKRFNDYLKIEPQSSLVGLKNGEVYQFEAKQRRNYKFLQKFFVLLQESYKLYEHPEGRMMSFENFREEVTKGAGYYEEYWDFDGNLHVKAKSISFARMKEPVFNRLYQDVITFIVHKVITGYTKDDLDDVVMMVIGFS
jgi:hypothetical protein